MADKRSGNRWIQRMIKIILAGVLAPLPVATALSMLVAPSVARGGEVVFGPRQFIHPGLSRRVLIADVNGDLRSDMITYAFQGAPNRWYENDGASPPSFQRHFIEGLPPFPNDPLAADLDGDGDADIIEIGDTEIAWWENLSGDGSSWNRKLIGPESLFEASSVVCDIDGDGDFDLVIGGNGALSWWENREDGALEWVRHVVGVASRPVATADVDGDGNVDILTLTFGLKNFGATTIHWWEHPGNIAQQWLRHEIACFVGIDPVNLFAPDISQLQAPDLDADGDLDLLFSIIVLSDTLLIRSTIVWLENRVDEGMSWEEKVITSESGQPDIEPNLLFPGFPSAADFDGDGDLDILASEAYGGFRPLGLGEIVWWENTEGSAKEWLRRKVDTDFDGDGLVRAIDLDLDGRPDALAAGGSVIGWWQNLGVNGGKSVIRKAWRLYP